MIINLKTTMTKQTDDGFAVTLDAPGYYSLAAVLQRAFDQASAGKGKERHANGLPFDQQPMQTIAAAHGVGFLTGQASKKAEESHGLPHDAKIKELLGAINYLAGAVIFLERVKPAAPVDVERAGEVVAVRYCTRSGDRARPICGECKPYGICAGI